MLSVMCKGVGGGVRGERQNMFFSVGTNIVVSTRLVGVRFKYKRSEASVPVKDRQCDMKVLGKVKRCTDKVSKRSSEVVEGV